MQLLIDNDADINIKDEDKFTPLHSIIKGNQNNWFECIELLLKNKADVNTKCYYKESGYQETPLITAVRNEIYIEFIKLLLKNGADVNIADSDGDKAINYAYDHHLYDILELLKEYGAEYDGKITQEEQIERGFAIGMAESYKIREKLNYGKILI
jgi:ankyrin repeat protein